MTNDEKTNQKVILIVDDDPLVRGMYQTKFEQEDFRVNLASNGEECLIEVTKEKPDIILLDLIMPKMNGVEVLRALKKYDRSKNIPVIILTNFSEKPEYIESAKKIGVFDFMMKSETNPQEIFEKVKNALNI